ncbi:MAG: ethanolamine ammonia-lyase subunit EutC [Candidatus Sumerlaeaceae bacterium]
MRGLLTTSEAATDQLPAKAPKNMTAFLKQFTTARIGIGRTGGSIPTEELLDFQLAHARARDAVHAPFYANVLKTEIENLGLKCVIVESAAPDRTTYLLNPDLGRTLSENSRAILTTTANEERFDLVFIATDGLSATAAHRQVVPLLREFLPLLHASNLRMAPIVIAIHGRVAIEDPIGEALRARLAVILVGERPGLGSPDSLGAYLVYEPRLGKTDADRNCISNIRPEGLPPAAAAHTLHGLVLRAVRTQLSGVRLIADDQIDVGVSST